MEKKDCSIHTTCTGKVFKLMDLKGNPLEYKEGKGIFTRSYLAALEVGQILRSATSGMMLQRIK